MITGGENLIGEFFFEKGFGREEDLDDDNFILMGGDINTTK